MIVAFRNKLGRIIGRRPAEMQVAALCLNDATGDVLLITSRGTGRSRVRIHSSRSSACWKMQASACSFST